MAVVGDGVAAVAAAVGRSERRMAGAAGGDDRQEAGEGAHGSIDNLVTKWLSSTKSNRLCGEKLDATW